MTLLVSLGCGLEVLLLCMGIILSLASLGPIKFLGQLSSNSTLLVATFIIDACAENLMVIRVQIMFIMKTYSAASKLQYLMADIVIAWRAWVIWAENRVVKFILAIMLLIDISRWNFYFLWWL